jgi:hypothetical protein
MEDYKPTKFEASLIARIAELETKVSRLEIKVYLSPAPPLDRKITDGVGDGKVLLDMSGDTQLLRHALASSLGKDLIERAVTAAKENKESTECTDKSPPH